MNDPLRSLVLASIAPPKKISVVEWLENNVKLTERVSPDFPGPYRTSLTPYVREVLERTADPSTRKITLCWAAQSAKSLTVILALAYRLANRPTNVVWGGPTIDFCRRFSQTKLRPVLENCDGLRAEMPKNKDEWKLLEMHFARATLSFAWSNSPQSLASASAGVVIADEIDKFGKAKGSEADPIRLLLERTKSSPTALHLLTSTPTTEDGPIWRHYLAGTRHKYYVPSPFTHEFFSLEFDEKFLRWDEGARNDDGTWDLERVRKTAHYVCPFSGEKITDSHKMAMLRKGEWRAENSHAPPGEYSYHLNSLYSPAVTFGRFAVEFLQTKNNPLELQNFRNSWLALPWVDMASRTEEADVMRRRGNYRRGMLPWRPAVVLVGVDVGQSYVRWVAVGVQENGSMAVADWGTEPAPEALLELLKNFRVRLPNSEDVKIDMGWVDAKYRKNEVNETCWKSGGKLWPACGTGGTYSARGVWFGALPPYPPPFGLTSYNDRDFKTKLYIDLIKEGKFPGIQFPENLDEQLVRELTSEHLVENRKAHAARRYEWKRTGDNHLGDALKLVLVGWSYLTAQSPGIETVKDNSVASTNDEGTA